MKLKFRLTSLALLAGLSFSSCQTANPYTGEAQRSKTANGALIGGLLGAAVGAISGDDSKERYQRAIRGGAIGAVVGGGVGAYMDKQEAELRRELQGTGVGIARRQDGIYLVMPGDITFATGSASISGQFYPVLNSVAKVLAKYNKTLVDINGHTDNVGGRSYNLRLSDSRGYDQPVASNASAAGRQKNRRVTINLSPLPNQQFQ